MQKITPFLWFNGQVEEAVNFYTAIFKNSKVGNISRYGDGAPLPAGTIMSAMFTLENQEFFLLNGGPQFTFTPAISFFINCKDQVEVDYYWEKLTADGGQPGQCGWLTDKFGLSWQVIPSALNELLRDKDSATSARVMQAMLAMNKIDIATLEKARDQK